MAKQSTIRDEIIFPLHAEAIAVAKERIATGRVRVSIVTSEREELVEEFLAREDVEIERRPVGKPVDRAPAVRRTGDMVIIPVVEEVLAVVRRLVVKEEICIRLVNRKEKHKQRVTVRSQEAIIERLPQQPVGHRHPHSHKRNQQATRDPQNR